MEIGQKALSYHVLMLGITIVGKGLDGNAATGIEQADDLKIFGVHQLDQVLHDDVDTILVEVAVVAEAEEVEFQAFAFHHQRARDIINNKVSKVGLAGLGAQRSELRTVQSHKVLVLRMFVLKRLQHFGGIIIAVVSVLIAQQRDTFQILFVS